MHIIESIKDNYLICDCCGDRIAPDEVALEKTDKEGRTIHICIDCENYATPEMEDLSESIEDDLARIEAGGFEAFRDEDYDDPGHAMAVHQAAQNAGMSDLDYVNNEERLDELFNEDLFIAELEEDGLNRDSIDLFIDDDLNDIHRPISEQYEELKNDGEVQDRGWNILNILRDGLDTDAYEISDGEYSSMLDLVKKLEKYKDDERTPVCAALYKAISAAYKELDELENL